jgi:hypothetical protein
MGDVIPIRLCRLKIMAWLRSALQICRTILQIVTGRFTKSPYKMLSTVCQLLNHAEIINYAVCQAVSANVLASSNVLCCRLVNWFSA